MHHIVVQESFSRACFARSPYRYWFQSYNLVKLGVVYDQNIPNLIKPPWKIMSVQNFTGKLLYT